VCLKEQYENASPIVEVKARKLVVQLTKFLLKLVDSEQQTYLYVGLLDMQINELEEVCPLN
jgi:hypothetical protein